MIEKSLVILVKEGKMFLIRLGRNELGAKSMIGLERSGHTALPYEEIGEAIITNLNVPKILTETENRDTDIFERSCVSAGFKDSNSFFRGGALVSLYAKGLELRLTPTEARGRRIVQHAFLEPIVLDAPSKEAVGKAFLRAVELCR